MIENEFVPEELAIILKEKGFDKSCFASYINNKLSIGFFHPGHCTLDTIFAPLWQQAISWLQEKHRIFISIEYAAPDTNKFHYRIDDYNPRYQLFEIKLISGKYENVSTGKYLGEFGIHSKEWWENREVCTEAAIRHAISLIDKPVIGTATSFTNAIKEL